MRVHYLQHVPFEDLAGMTRFFSARGADVTGTRLYEETRFPDPNDLDCLVILGGPMSINDTSKHPWMQPELNFIRAALDARARILGICLGAQWLAKALGAAVTPNAEKEIGWFPVHRDPDGAITPFADRLPESFEAFHWHGETFDLPSNARRIARNEGCLNQGFVWEDRVVALQFHLETTPDAVRNLCAHCCEDLAPGRFVQSPAAMLETPERFPQAHQLMEHLLDPWLK